jgi:hypothetical protein
MRVSIAAYLADLGGTRDDARALFGSESWWDTKFSSARWQDFVRASSGLDVPKDVTGVVADVARRLAPILEDSP